MQYFYEGKTIRGMGWVQWSLWIFLAALVATVLVSVILASVLSEALTTNPFAALPRLMGAVAALCGLVILEIAGLALYLAGFTPMYGGRQEYGPRHAREMDWSLVCFIVTAVLYIAQSAVPSNTFVFLPGASTIADASTAGLTLAALAVLRAAFTATAGLALLFGVYAFADAGGIRRLLLALVLGIAGSVVGSVVTIVGLYTLPPSEYGTMLIAGALGGTGVGLIALVLYVLVYRDVAARLRSGAIPPVLPPRPMFPPPYYYPAYAVPWAPPPAAPSAPPPPPSPPAQRP